MFYFFQYHLNVAIVFFFFFFIYLGYFLFKSLKNTDLRNAVFSKTLLNSFPSSVQEIPKFGLFRSVFGLFLLHRCFAEWLYILPQDFQSVVYVTALSITTIFSLFIIFGFMTNIALLGMVAFYFGETFIRSSTLANDVAAILSIMLSFCFSYKTYSLDRLIELKLIPKWNSLNLNVLFNLSGGNADLQISRAKYIVVLSYWCLCLYSAFKHFSSPTWMNGDASLYLLTSSYLSQHFEFFRAILSYDIIAEIFKYSMFFMFPWYLVFLPAFFIRGILLKFVIIWWFLFLILSEFALNLSHLGLFEFVLFGALLLVPTRIKGRIVTFFYDGKCNLCARAIKVIKFLDFSRRVRFITVQSGEDILKSYGVSKETALTQLAGTYKDHVYIGYNLYNLLAHKLPLLWITLPLFYLGRLFGIGSKLYQIIANNRIRMFGTCALPIKKSLKILKIKGNNFTQILNRSATTTICVFALIFLSNPPIYPKDQNYEDVYREIFGSFYRTGNMLGIAAIDVFNYNDLNMSNNWRVIEYCNRGTCNIVPLNNIKGDRLKYHHSDTLYYGGTVRWRRLNIEEKNLCDYGKEEFVSTEYINQIAMLYLRKKSKEFGLFKIHYYYNPLPDLNTPEWPDSFKNYKKTCTVSFTISKNGTSKLVEKKFYE